MTPQRARTLGTHVATLVLAVLLAGCAISPRSASDWQRSEQLWSEQLNQVPAQADNTRAPRLWVLAAGLHDNSKAFEGDVLAMQEALSRLNPNAVVLTLNNPHAGGELKRPFGTPDNLRRALQTMGSRMRSGDTALVFISTHGHINRLAVAAGNQELPAMTGQDLNQMLAPLVPHATGVIVSACHSGSLIPALRSPNRWVMTAAAADRNSFGCNFHGKQTFFVQALLKNMDEADNDLPSWSAATNKTVLMMEQAQRLSPHSNPQLWIGPSMQQQLASNRLSRFFKPPLQAAAVN